MPKQILYAALLFSFLTSNSWGEVEKTAPFQPTMRKSTIHVLQNLRKKGYEKIGAEPIKDLISSAEKTRWIFREVYWEGGEDSDLVTGVTSFLHNRAAQGIPFLEAYNKKVLRVVPVFGFTTHEAFGALGVLDTHYGVSLSAAFLSVYDLNIPSPSLKKLFEDRLRSAGTLANKRIAGGGSVGGGGHIAAFDLKFKIIEDFVFGLSQKKFGYMRISAEKALQIVLDAIPNSSYDDSEYRIGFSDSYGLGIKVTHNDWFSDLKEERQNYREKILALVQWIISDPDVKALHQKSEAEFIPPKHTGEMIQDLRQYLKERWVATLAFQVGYEHYRISAEQAKELVDNLQIKFSDEDKFEVSYSKPTISDPDNSQPGSYSLTVPKKRWLEDPYFGFVVQLVVSTAMSDIDYEKLVTKK